MYKDLLVQEAELFKKYLLRGTPAAPAPAPVASQPEPVASSAAPVASEVASGAIEAQSSSANEVVTTAPVASEPTVVAPVKEKVSKEVVTKETQKETQTNATPSDKGSDADWVNQLPEEGFVLQLAAFDVEDEIQAFKRSHPAYASARVMQVRKKDTNKRYFILLAGPFETKPEADRFMKSSPLLSKGWLRSVKSVKAQLTKG
jgi:septal ring-binding cell division protein DamX